jgi:hypothetical protein
MVEFGQKRRSEHADCHHFAAQPYGRWIPAALASVKGAVLPKVRMIS